MELNRLDTLLPILRWELLTAVVLLFLALATLIRRDFFSWRTLFVLTAWVCWAARLIIMPHESLTIYGFDLALWLGLILPAVVAVPLGIIDTAIAWTASKRACGQLLAWAAGISVLFLIPFWLWSQGSIKQYQTATTFALGLVVVLVLVGRQLIDIKPPAPAGVSSSADKSSAE